MKDTKECEVIANLWCSSSFTAAFGIHSTRLNNVPQKYSAAFLKVKCINVLGDYTSDTWRACFAVRIHFKVFQVFHVS